MDELILISWIIFSLVIAGVGASRKIGFWWALLASIFLSPISGLILVSFSKDLQDEYFKRQILEELSILTDGQKNIKSEKVKSNGSKKGVDDTDDLSSKQVDIDLSEI